MLHAVIMAGGAGTRFWPESRRLRPKQLLGMLGDRTMIQATADRLGDLAPSERIYVATTALLAEQIGGQLPQLPDGAILVRPDRFVGWRSPDRSPEPAAILRSALECILFRGTNTPRGRA